MKIILSILCVLHCVFVVNLSASAAEPITLRWQDNSSNETGFKVERRTGDATEWLTIRTTGPNTTEHVDDLAAPGVLQHYRVKAFNAAGDSGYSNTASVMVPAAGVSPDGGPIVLELSVPGRLVNISARAHVVAGDGVLIGGFVVADGERSVLIRVIGPGLAGADVEWSSPLLADPRLSLRSMDGTEVAANDNWSGSDIEATAARVGAFPLTAGSADAALLITLQPGQYTVIASGAAGQNGIALCEIYDVSVP